MDTVAKLEEGYGDAGTEQPRQLREQTFDQCCHGDTQTLDWEQQYCHGLGCRKRFVGSGRHSGLNGKCGGLVGRAVKQRYSEPVKWI